MIQAQYIFIYDAMLEVLTTGWSDIAVDQLADRMAELEEEDDEGESGYLTEFNVKQSLKLHCMLFPSLETENRSETVQ